MTADAHEKHASHEQAAYRLLLLRPLGLATAPPEESSSAGKVVVRIPVAVETALPAQGFCFKAQALRCLWHGLCTSKVLHSTMIMAADGAARHRYPHHPLKACSVLLQAIRHLSATGRHIHIADECSRRCPGSYTWFAWCTCWATVVATEQHLSADNQSGTHQPCQVCFGVPRSFRSRMMMNASRAEASISITRLLAMAAPSRPSLQVGSQVGSIHT